jgi:tetratricopeptide (TPR) repeat protein
MLQVKHFGATILAFVLFFGCGSEIDYSERTAPLFENLGSHHYSVTTNSNLAQKYFDQGLILTYGFNHQEAFRSFKEATIIDANCAMGYWGMALVLGPNINAPMENSEIQTAYDAIQKAISVSDNVSEKEKDFILALSARYSNNPPEDRTPLDVAYSEAMRKLVEKYPDDVEAAALFSESLMDLHPWDFWLKDGTAQPWTQEIVSSLERTLELDADHPGANHLYIHTVEASKAPERALPSANTLRQLIPGAGHLVHMPSHIYIRVGKYHEGSLANEMAVKSDEEYLTQCYQQGLYPLAYYPHNYHFLWATATLEGRSELAIDAALKTAQKPPDSLLNVCGYQTLQHYKVIPYHAYIRFGKWDEILIEPKPLDEHMYPQAIWHYARGMAFTAMDQLDKAEVELSNVKEFSNNAEIEKLSIWGLNEASNLVKIAVEVLAGEIAAKKKNYNQAVKHFEKAIVIEYLLNYDEPPTWFFPVRHNLGAVLIDAGRFEEAERVYKEDLDEFPHNGWSLYGLTKTLKKQHKMKEAEKAEEQFNKAWQYADVKISSSRIM